MKADAVPLLVLFEKKMRLEIPLFQRQYVWGKDQQWEPLWEDIERKFSEYIEGRKNAPVHFLGAMVLDQKQTPSTHVEKRQVIDGQQRLTTLQIFLAAFRDFCGDNNLPELQGEINAFTLNKGMMANPEVDKYKVWPTQRDRSQFQDVLSSGSFSSLLEKHPIVYKKYARKPTLRPKMVEAYFFFYEKLANFFKGTDTEKPLGHEHPLADRIDECLQSLKNALRVVVIDLDTSDDAQIIFETLNARGEPLLPADLLRNYIFLRAGHKSEPQDELYESYWKEFDDPFWREPVKQGRLLRPRCDLFMQHYLSAKQATDIPIKHLFAEYRYWIESTSPFASVKAELIDLADSGKLFKRIASPSVTDDIYETAVLLDAFDVKTCYPVLLFILKETKSQEELLKTTQIIESYIIRRAICGLTTKNYNRFFINIIKIMQRDGFSYSVVRSALEAQKSESSVWPDDSQFYREWMNSHIYHRLNNPKVVYIMRRMNKFLMSGKTEKLESTSNLSVEHVMPQSWIANWPLPNGETGLSIEKIWELERSSVDTENARFSKERHSRVQTIGNLTIMTQPLNSSVSNGSWRDKKTQILRNSVLPINNEFIDYEEWDERSIKSRADILYKRAVSIWPR